ncbi:MAG: hypothetical protein ABIT71_23130 [Vicinamibacteraceae bacterium]
MSLIDGGPPSRMAAFVGFAPSFPLPGSGILRRSGIHAVCLPDVGRALAVLAGKIVFDALVLNLVEPAVQSRADRF